MTSAGWGKRGAGQARWHLGRVCDGTRGYVKGRQSRKGAWRYSMDLGMCLRLSHGSGECVRVQVYVYDMWCRKVQNEWGRMYEVVRQGARGAMWLGKAMQV